MINRHLFEYDNRAGDNGRLILCGVDEAGRGPLAGPVVAAAVILKENSFIDRLDDSKKLSEHRREILFEEIKRNAVSYGIAFVDNAVIDEINILEASMKAMTDAIKQLTVKPDIIIIDGNTAPKGIQNALTVAKGDSLSASIAAASILAKVSRDRYMAEISANYPGYSFAKHKGYGTKEHYEEIGIHGITSIHRRSFLKRNNRYFNVQELDKNGSSDKK